jgi:hypothetical protein
MVRARLLPLLLAALVGCGDDQDRADGAVTPDGAVPDVLRRDGAPVDVPDAGVPDAAWPDPDYGSTLPARYGPTTHSPITPRVAQRLHAIAQKNASRNGGVFAKVGNSMTEATAFLHCFAGSSVKLGAHPQLGATIAHFSTDLGSGVTPFDRKSLCAVGGWPAHSAIAGNPSPLQQELDAISPRFAVVMFGSNDIGWNNIWQYAGAMLSITDQLAASGVIPILTLIPPRDDSAPANLQVPRYNAVVRCIGQARQVPVIDLHRELLKLPKNGISSDGLHLNALGGGCDLTAAGLSYGYNMRNLLTLQALERCRRVVVDKQPAPDPPTAQLAGDGKKQSPFVIDALPFHDSRDTKGWPQRLIASYSCAPQTDESGPEYFYRLVLKQPTKIRAMVFDGDNVDIDLHLLDSTAAGAGCIARDDREVTASLQPGTYHLVLDTYVKSGVEKAGEYLLVVLAD